MEQDLSELLFNSLNEQGFLFQEACAHCLRKERTGWIVEAFEYPVSLQGEDTRVDIVLRGGGQGRERLWAILECKRADPEYVNWLFSSPGLPHGLACFSTLGLECQEVKTNPPRYIRKLVETRLFGVHTYQAKSWMEVKRTPKKDFSKRASSPQNIENAFSQVLRGTGGFAEEHHEQMRKDITAFRVFFIPIVITTAKLYVADYKLEDVDLETGTINREKVHFAPKGQPPEEVEWVLVDYGAGENVAPGSIPEDEFSTDPNQLQKYKTRSIFVVNSKSIIRFFSKLHLG